MKVLRVRGLIAFCALFLPNAVPAASGRLHYPLPAHIPVPDQPFDSVQMSSPAGAVRFYLSEEPQNVPGLRPLVVYVQGSGCNSLFERVNGQTRAMSGLPTVADVWRGHARLLALDKPGVHQFDEGGSCEKNAAFNRNFSLETWSRAIERAIVAARTSRGIDPRRVLVIGHSEGGVAAARVAHDLSSVVTDVAIMAGEGPSQLYSLIALARSGSLFREISSDPEQRVAYVIDEWNGIRQHPSSTDRQFFGFSYLRWSSFLRTSVLDELAKTHASIHISQGTADANVDPSASDVLYAQLLSKGRSVTYDRIENADHSFNIAGNDHEDGWLAAHKRIRDWFWNNNHGLSGRSTTTPKLM
jgi:pimeloyl-ACP methyl ester carboxylesterase